MQDERPLTPLIYIKPPQRDGTQIVMAGLDPAIHLLRENPHEA
jgi:hypothetical protein